MKTSESIKEIALALVDSQSKIRFAIKDSINPHFKNRYADLGSVIDAIKESLNLNGIAFIQTPTESQIGTLALTTRLIHKSGEWIEDTAICPLSKNDPQGYGSALTYLRRYSLASITGLYQDDDDGEASRVKPEDMIRRITNSSTMEELQNNFKLSIKDAGNNAELVKAITFEKDKMKTMLSERLTEQLGETK